MQHLMHGHQVRRLSSTTAGQSLRRCLMHTMADDKQHIAPSPLRV